MGYLQVPATWERVSSTRVAGFVTSEIFRRPDGGIVHWDSRSHRKRDRGAISGSTWWAPRALGWWVAVLFAIGSACFAIGPAPFYLELVGYEADCVTFFVGSIFFTSAALLQYIQTVAAPRTVEAPGVHQRAPFLGIEPRRIDWWAASVQLVGTLWFNLTTFAALLDNLDAEQAKRLIWTPDAIGSICFLVASALAFAEVGHRLVSWMPHFRSWRITALNLAGSIAFGISAIASYILPTTGEPASVFWTNFGTFIGALCFFAGAILLMPERTHPDTDPDG